jgi:hypothetical protein
MNVDHYVYVCMCMYNCHICCTADTCQIMYYSKGVLLDIYMYNVYIQCKYAWPLVNMKVINLLETGDIYYM